MADFLDNYDDIVFLESEIEDDDENAPVGELIEVVDGKVRIAAKPAVTSGLAEEAPMSSKEEVASEDEEGQADSEPVAEEAQETVTEMSEADSEPEKVESEEGTDALPAADPIYLYPYGIEPVAQEAPAQNVVAQDEEMPSAADDAASEETPQEDAQPAPEEPLSQPDETVEETVNEEVNKDEAAQTKDTFADEVPVPVEESVAAEPEKSVKPAKKAAKPVSHTIIQAASDDGGVWGNAVIKPVTKKKTAKKDADAQTDKESVAEQTAPAAKKSSASKKKAATNDNAEIKDTKIVKEETKVAKTKAASDDAKKEAPKTAKKEAAKPETKKAAPAAKAEAKKPAEKKAPATKPAKEDTKKEESREQVIEEGDASTPHGKFVIKKTDKGNFVYKLYSSNYRVVAIGAGLYTSIASCKTGINSVRNNAASAPIEDQTLQKWEELKFPKWQIYTDKQGEIRLRLLASNGNIVATTNDGYLSKEAAKKGIAAIARAAKGAEIVRNDDLW